MSVLQAVLFSLSIYTLMACLSNLIDRTLQANHWFVTFQDIAKTLREHHGYVDAGELADEVEEVAWKILEVDRKRTIWGRRWLKKYWRDKMLKRAQQIAEGTEK